MIQKLNLTEPLLEVCTCQGASVQSSLVEGWKMKKCIKNSPNPSRPEEAALEALLSKIEALSTLHHCDIKVFSDSEIIKGSHLKMNDTIQTNSKESY